MDHEFPECEKLTGRRRAICRGEAGLPIDGKHGVNAYRKSWGIEPYPFNEPRQPPQKSASKPVLKSLKSMVMTESPDPQMGRYAGTNLAMLLKRFGVEVQTGCNCEEWIDKMNRWSPVENYLHRQEIVDRLKSQSEYLKQKGQLGLFKQVRIAFLMLRNFNLPTVEELVDEAIYQARQHSSRSS